MTSRSGNFHQEERAEQCENVDVQSTDYRAIAKVLFDCVRRHRSNPALEVEVRLCQFTTERDPCSGRHDGNCNTQSNGLRFADVNVTSSVSAEDFECFKTFLQSEFQNNRVSKSTTRDVVAGGWRYTYDVDGNKSTRCIACVRKKRLFVKNISVPFGAYNLRFAVSTEVSGGLPVEGAAPKMGYTRLKERLSIMDGLFCYDLTRVTEKETVVYEVELEAVFTSCETQLTESFLESFLERAVKLATLPNKK